MRNNILYKIVSSDHSHGHWNRIPKILSLLSGLITGIYSLPFSLCLKKRWVKIKYLQ